jgi:hypothetical protein
MHVLPTVAYHGSRYFSKPEMAAQSFQTVQAKSKGYCRDAPAKNKVARVKGSLQQIVYFIFLSSQQQNDLNQQLSRD